MQIFDVTFDKVIGSHVALGKSTYEYALANYLPLINRFTEQRKIQRQKFYDRLEKDILAGCVMPTITLAFVINSDTRLDNPEDIQVFLEKNIGHGYILDGMQRLTTLSRANETGTLDLSRSLYFNVIFAYKYDLLLYRMITLNNGQKPMTLRHQIEMLTMNLVDQILKAGELQNISILSEKETERQSPVGSYKRSLIATAYTAFLADTVHVQNSKIIEEKLDEILVGKVMDSHITETDASFEAILRQVDRLSSDNRIKSWFSNEINFVGFTVGSLRNFNMIETGTLANFSTAIGVFDEAFKSINRSKVNIGKIRRELVCHFFATPALLQAHDVQEVVSAFSDFTA
jgi:hypothetical protein